MTNREEYAISIYSNEMNNQVKVNNNIYDLPIEIKVKRSKNDLPIKLISNTKVKNYVLKPSLNHEFIFGNLIWSGLSPAAFLIDLTNQKRFYYGKFICLNMSDTTRIVKTPLSKLYDDYFLKSYPTYKGQLYLNVAFPWVNNFFLQPENEKSRINTGFMGASIGLEYFYKDTKFVAINANAVIDFFIPIPAAVDFGGGQEFMNSTYLSLTDNWKYNHFRLGSGISISKNVWIYTYFDWPDLPPAPRENVKIISYSMGLIINGYYQFRESFFIGLIYRPNFLKVHPKTKFEYEHLLSLEFGWRIDLKKFLP